MSALNGFAFTWQTAILVEMKEAPESNYSKLKWQTKTGEYNRFYWYAKDILIDSTLYENLNHKEDVYSKASNHCSWTKS